MAVSFARLRIAGFKSFAEPAAIEIRPGLTGIVGPNGCGKSNVVEALRWGMGENSARSLRGGEMDDVIFSGTAARASRNIAEVTLFLEDAAGRLPPPWHEQADLEISRRIERGVGSAFRVNGREVRARDVQTLFADLASGARASAMVSQGRVGALVGARPDDRRAILEEAAGITGLHARRHEAELKLRAAEANLARAEDLRGQLEQQVAGLKRQARQANRYRNLSGAIREAEAELLAVQHARAEAARQAALAALDEARRAVEAATMATTAAATRATEAAAALPKLRTDEAAARTALERHRLAQEQIAAEERSARAGLEAAEQRLAQVVRDLGHARQIEADAAAASARLTDEDGRLAEEAAVHPAGAEAAAALLAEAEYAVRAAEAEANRATDHAAELAARANACAQALAQAKAAERRAREHLGRLEQERAAIRLVDPARLAEAEAERARAEVALATARGALEDAEQARQTAHASHGQALAAAGQAEAARARLAAEVDALADVLGAGEKRAGSGANGTAWRPVLDALAVPPGLETALGAALGDELESSADGAEERFADQAEGTRPARHWCDLGPLDPCPPLPAGITSLAALVQAPASLGRALSQIGLVEGEVLDQGSHAQLLPGQALVSREGAVWRWDGYAIRAGAPSAAAVRLQQRNRLAGLRPRLAEAAREAAAAGAERATAAAAETAANAAERQARAALRDSEQQLERARSAAARLAAEASSAAARAAGLDDRLDRARAEQAEAELALVTAQEAQAAIPDLAGARVAVEAARTTLAARRAAEATARAEADALARAESARSQRRRAIAAEQLAWSERASHAAERVVDLAARHDSAQTEVASLSGAPERVATRRVEASVALERAEAAHRSAAEALAAAEQESASADHAARAAESALSKTRESLVRAEGALEHAEHARVAVDERVRERLGDAALPDLPAAPAQETDSPPDWDAAEERARKRFERLYNEREQMGPVNLRAELEAREVEQQIGAIAAERAELDSAIAKLRGSIGHLNREGRERLATVFEQVDRNFQELFARMFGGGRAHLALVGSDDPLEAGLEIYAQPPGKRLATLSLLSGGEQALTALSLIFAVFRCNPAPVCVLDEVDAPLDDANVERFCNLLDDMARSGGTRFLVVTHHPLTMARMDQLYGVTMQERGISRVLSVDLQRATELAEQPRMAAE